MPKGKYAHTVHNGSANDQLLGMEVGDYRYVETTAENIGATMRAINTPRTRRPAALEGREFTCTAYTAVAGVGKTKVLVKIERIH